MDQDLAPPLPPTTQVNNLREIQALRRLSPHPGVIKLCEVLYDQPTRRLALVFELMDMNIYELIRGRRHYLPEARIKSYMYQLLKSMDHMHRNGIFHRDIKVTPPTSRLPTSCSSSCLLLRFRLTPLPRATVSLLSWATAGSDLPTHGGLSHKTDKLASSRSPRTS